MKFLVDENVPQQLITDLRNKDHNVLDVKDSSHQREPDPDLLEIARKENRVIVTYDKDFLTGKLAQEKHAKIVIRIPYADLSFTRKRLLEVLNSYSIDQTMITVYPYYEHVEKL